VSEDYRPLPDGEARTPTPEDYRPHAADCLRMMQLATVDEVRSALLWWHKAGTSLLTGWTWGRTERMNSDRLTGRNLLCARRRL